MQQPPSDHTLDATLAALRESEQRLRLALDAVQMTVWERDLRASAVTFHTADAALAQAAPVQETRAGASASFLDEVHPDDRETMLAASRAARSRGGHFDVEYRVLGHAGERWRHTSGRVFSGDDGRPVRMVGVDRDVTERKVAERAAQEREARLRLITAQLPAVLWSVDRELRFTSSTGAGLAALGLVPDQVVGTTLHECLGTDDPAAPPLAAVARALGGQSSDYESAMAERVFHTHVEPLRDAAGQVAGVIGLSLDVTDRRRLEQQLAHQAFHDALTGLANRALFRDRVGHALERCATARDGRRECVAVLFLDLDDFKGVNDALGHAAGDELLRRVAERLRHATRGYDTIARLGGDEFAVLLEGMLEPGDADVVAARVLSALADARVRASLGLAHATGGESVDELLRNADVAMYEAKAAGKGSCVVFAPDMHRALVARVELEADLRAAVDALADGADGGFRLLYQPVVDLASGAVLSFEALMRWQHPARGLVSPAQFIPLTEETGLIVPLGGWAVREVCRQLQQWDAEGRAGARVAVNVSGRQLEHASLVADVAAAIAEHGVDPARLTLEITETAVMRDAERTLAALHALKALGVQLAVDDFGTGYSSLAYLQQFPVDVLKIDKRSVDGVARGGSDTALARTIIALGESCGLRTVAEGVEREEQREALAGLGCALAQGYLFARPLLPDEAKALLSDSSSPSCPAASRSG